MLRGLPGINTTSLLARGFWSRVRVLHGVCEVHSSLSWTFFGFRHQLGSPWPDLQSRGPAADGFPACLLAGDEGEVGEKKEGAKSYLEVCSARVGTAGGGLLRGAGAPAAAFGGGGDGPAGLGGSERVREHQRSVGELAGVSFEADGGRRGELRGGLGGGGGHGGLRRPFPAEGGSPWPDLQSRGPAAAGFPACLLAGGEREVGEKKEGAKSYLEVCSARAGKAGGGLLRGAGAPAAAVGGGGDGPAGLGGSERVREHQRSVGELAGVSFGAEG
ncbi:spidroin-1-like [Panicum virgatum]|uniref:spidroin-1-like n=1 Tax=Panicum virgatum TaxID=38727 RepID=UPI0019D51EF6|nr:spidroin-1-like [Panicum virgatum]